MRLWLQTGSILEQGAKTEGQSNGEDFDDLVEVDPFF
jgi:hypothetical protein